MEERMFIMERRRLILAAGLALAAPVPAVWAWDDKGDPFAFIVEVSNDVLDAIRKDPALAQGDPEHVRALVDGKIMPVVDFSLMTRMTVGPDWRKASAEEKSRLEKGFRDLLIRVYSGALVQVKDLRCELRPTRVKKVKDEMVIRTLLKSAGEPDIGLDYRIYRAKDGAWKIVDVNVEGIWLVENYRSQFASVLSAEGVQGLIRMLETRANELAAKNKPQA